MAINIARRKFIAALGGTAFAWPLAARAQQRVRRIGVLMVGAQADSEAQARLGHFSMGCNSWTGPSAATCESTLAGSTSGGNAARRN
jgi:hypothetical protein